VTFRVARAVLALAVGLVNRLAVDPGARGARALVVCVDIIDMDDETGVASGESSWCSAVTRCSQIAVSPARTSP